MQNFNTKTIREIAVDYPAATRVFEVYKIDYCCGGGLEFADACRIAGVKPEIVNAKLNSILTAAADDSEFVADQSSTSALIDYILEKHHVFTRQELSRLTPLMEKVCRKHGAHYAELFGLQKLFTELKEDLIPHLAKEENVLFPFIKNLELSDSNNLSAPQPPFGTVKNPVRMMMDEHDKDGEVLRRMRELTGGYVLPEGACASFQALYFGLEELEKDLHRHIHLENNVLFPKAVRLEQKVVLALASIS